MAPRHKAPEAPTPDIETPTPTPAATPEVAKAAVPDISPDERLALRLVSVGFRSGPQAVRLSLGEAVSNGLSIDDANRIITILRGLSDCLGQHIISIEATQQNVR